ncbi:hypothetical protein [Microbacterium sp.]|uniref:phosphotransferase-like protein n=1 Tax=Microbacterium sp. TaxID=51671 RepID=UPI003459EB22
MEVVSVAMTVQPRIKQSPLIVLNGGSNAGKSTIARALQEALPGIWLTFGVDTFIDALPGKGDSPRSGIGREERIGDN